MLERYGAVKGYCFLGEHIMKTSLKVAKTAFHILRSPDVKLEFYIRCPVLRLTG